MINPLDLQLIIYSAVCLLLLSVYAIGYLVGRRRVSKQAMWGSVLGAVVTMVALPYVLIYFL